MFTKIFKELGLPESSHRVYLRLLEIGSSSARQLAENLNIPRPSVYDNLKLLIENGLVLEREEENKKIFYLNEVRNLSQLVEEKINTLKKEKEAVDLSLPALAKKIGAVEPKIRFYPGAKGIKQVLRDLLWYDHIETLTMWPISEMMEVLGASYMEDINRRRIRRGISIRGIWPQDKAVNFKDFPFMGVGEGFLRELRLAPKGTTWNMSYWLYADKVAFISSRTESFGFVIHSRDFTELLKAQFEVIWKISKPIKPQPQYTDKFLKTV